MEDGLESSFGRAQRVLGRAPVMDVECDRDPSNDVALRISDWGSASEMPAILAVLVSNPIFELGLSRRFQRTAPAPRQLLPILGVYGVERPFVGERPRARSCR